MISAKNVMPSQLKIVFSHPVCCTSMPIVNVEIAQPRYAIEFKNPETVETLPAFSNLKGRRFTKMVFTAIMDAVMTDNNITVSSKDLLPSSHRQSSDTVAARKKQAAVFVSCFFHFRYKYCAAYAPVRLITGRTVVTRMESAGDVRKVSLI